MAFDEERINYPQALIARVNLFSAKVLNLDYEGHMRDSPIGASIETIKILHHAALEILSTNKNVSVDFGRLTAAIDVLHVAESMFYSAYMLPGSDRTEFDKVSASAPWIALVLPEE